MSRVHEALRRAQQAVSAPSEPTSDVTPTPPGSAAAAVPVIDITPSSNGRATSVAVAESAIDRISPLISEELLEKARTVPWNPAPDAHLLDPARPHEAPAEEFRTIRTRLNHMQSLQPLHTLVVTSPSPAEGKSFTAANLAIAQAQLEGNRTLLLDCDFRRPIVHGLFQIDRTPGLTDLLLGKAELSDILVRLEGTNLWVIPAGSAVINPLELLNLREVRILLEQLPRLFNWIILDSPPLLFAADANLLSTLADGAVLVVRIGSTTIDSVTRAIQSLCENNVVGVVVNGARRGELYSRYTYYHSYYYTKYDERAAAIEAR
jgi:receptor protein-tyrosine kinase